MDGIAMFLGVEVEVSFRFQNIEISMSRSHPGLFPSSTCST